MDNGFRTFTPNAPFISQSAAAGAAAWGITSGSFAVGTDASPLKIGTNNSLVIDASGRRTLPRQPMFHAFNSADQNNVTGDGTTYKVLFATPTVNISSSLSGSTFTAPITGMYYFDMSVFFLPVSGAMDTGELFLNINSGATIYTLVVNDAFNSANDVFAALLTGNVLIPLSASDTVIVQIRIAGGTKTVDIPANGATAQLTYFSGYLAG